MQAVFRQVDIPSDIREYFVSAGCGECYVCRMVAVFCKVHRVLRDDGVLFLNLGDSYASGGSGSFQETEKQASNAGTLSGPLRNMNRVAGGLKPKDLCGIPWRVALALQASGWYLRSDMPWVKRSSMPESVTDRPAKAVEYMFLLTKQPKYYFDMDAIRQPIAPATIERDRHTRILENDGPQAIRHDHETQANPAGRNFRNADLWFQSIEAPHGMCGMGDELVGLDVNTAGFPKAHFATFPPKLIEPCVLAGTSNEGCCPECGAPWKRVVEKTQIKRKRPADRTARHEAGEGINSCGNTVAGVDVKTTGWEPTCKCGNLRLRDDVPAAIIDELHSLGLV